MRINTFYPKLAIYKYKTFHDELILPETRNLYTQDL